jgi:DNA-binding SARP family transcriptional activator/streptogramin lyase
MEIHLLGLVKLRLDGDDVALGAAKQRAVLAMLALHANERVSADRLAEGLWGEQPPPSATKMVQIYVSRLRKLLEGAEAQILTRGRGYELRIPADRVDALRFERLVEAASRNGGDTNGALEAALSLWRGPPLDDLADEPFAAAEIRRLEELWLRARELAIDEALASGEHGRVIAELDELVAQHPLRERLHARRMLALYGCGRQAEALEAYHHARELLVGEIGVEPGPELRSVQEAILRQDPALEPRAEPRAAVRPERRRAGAVPPREGRRRVLVVASVVAIGAALLLAAAVALGGINLTGDETPTPPRVLPNSLVRIDPDTLEATDVVRVGSAPDLVMAAGGFVWITHHVLRDFGSARVRDAGDRTLKRVDPETGKVETVGGGLAPCGLAPDPSGDVWVANCFAAGGGDANVVRVDATTLDFEATYPVPERGLPAGEGYYRGLAYGGGSLWVGALGERSRQATVIQLDPRSGKQRAIRLPAPATGALAWAETSGELWVANFDEGTLTRVRASTRAVETVDVLSVNPAHILVDGEVVWVADWALPGVERLPAVGPSRQRLVELPVRNVTAGVWNIAAGEGYIWATTPRDRALWRIDPKTNEVKRIPMPYPPTGVTANEGDIWVTVRRTCHLGCRG